MQRRTPTRPTSHDRSHHAHPADGEMCDARLHCAALGCSDKFPAFARAREKGGSPRGVQRTHPLPDGRAARAEAANQRAGCGDAARASGRSLIERVRRPEGEVQTADASTGPCARRFPDHAWRARSVHRRYVLHKVRPLPEPAQGCTGGVEVIDHYFVLAGEAALRMDI